MSITPTCQCLEAQSMLGRSLVEASTAIMALEQTGDFRFEGLTLNQWQRVRTLITIDLDGTVIEHRKHEKETS